MIKILMSGCNGKMGQVITRLSKQRSDVNIAAGFDITSESKGGYPVYTDLNQCREKIDVIIDFSNPSAFEKVIGYAIKNKVPLVLATTGLSQAQMQTAQVASKVIPIFYSANMSLGISLLISLVKKAAKFLEHNFDIEIIEKHHNEKIDAPSGTALAIADSINEVLDNKYDYTYDRHSRRKKRSRNEIGIHSLRGGTIIGEHSVVFAGNDEILTIEHTAMSKDIFAVGALKACEFICGKEPGMYGMEDMLKEEE
jgi:4-hydroxy-tetrahydrodipicolinate reductase